MMRWLICSTFARRACSANATKNKVFCLFVSESYIDGHAVGQGEGRSASQTRD